MLPPIFADNRRGMLYAIVVSALVQGALAVVLAFQMRIIFAAFHNDLPPPVEPLVILLFGGLAILTLRVVELAVGDKLAHSYIKVLRSKLFNHISRVSTDDLRQHRQGSLQIRFVGDLSAIQSWVGRAIPGLIAASVLLPSLLCLLFWLHPYMGLTGVIMAALCIVVIWLGASTLQEHHKAVRNKRGQLANYVAARIAIAPQLRIMGLRSAISKRLNIRSESLQHAAVKKSMWVNSFKSVPDVFLQGLSMTCILLAFYLDMRAPEAAMILAIVAICHQPLKNVADFWDKRNAYLVSRRKCSQFLSMKSLTKGPKFRVSSKEHVQITGKNLSNLDTRFPDFTLESGQSMLIHGPMGSGKSSLLELLVGLNSPETGGISVNQKPVTRLTDTSRQRLFYFLSEDVPVFSSSLKQTLTMGLRQSPSTRALNAAIEKFKLTNLANRLGGLQGAVAELGKNLSEGEIKRIACCRAYLSGAKFILIDDVDSLAGATDHDTVIRLINDSDSTVVACARHLEVWRPLFMQSLSLSLPTNNTIYTGLSLVS